MFNRLTYCLLCRLLLYYRWPFTLLLLLQHRPGWQSLLVEVSLSYVARSLPARSLVLLYAQLAAAWMYLSVDDNVPCMSQVTSNQLTGKFSVTSLVDIGCLRVAFNKNEKMLKCTLWSHGDTHEQLKKSEEGTEGVTHYTSVFICWRALIVHGHWVRSLQMDLGRRQPAQTLQRMDTLVACHAFSRQCQFGVGCRVSVLLQS